jgi:hypothetical protein
LAKAEEPVQSSLGADVVKQTEVRARARVDHQSPLA